jgi:hypothetical protein
MRGHVQVRTRSIDGKLRATLYDLSLTNRMRDSRMSQVPKVKQEDCNATGSGREESLAEAVVGRNWND